MTGLDVQVGASITIGDVERVADSMVDRLRPHSDPKPFYMSRTDARISDGTNPILLDLLAPPTGSIWQLRSITMFGIDAFTVVENVFCAVFVGDLLNLSLAGLKVTGLAIPSTTYVPDTVMWCHPNENLVVQVGMPGAVPVAGQQVGVNIGIEEWRERDVSRSTGA